MANWNSDSNSVSNIRIWNFIDNQKSEQTRSRTNQNKCNQFWNRDTNKKSENTGHGSNWQNNGQMDFLRFSMFYDNF